MVRRSLVIKTAIVSGLVLLLGAAGLTYFAIKARKGLEVRYTAAQAGFLIAEYIEVSGGDWPADWEALRNTYNQNPADSRGFDEWRSWIAPHIRVDWDVDSELLSRATSVLEVPYPVIRCVDGRPAGPTEWHEANAIICRAFADARDGEPEPEVRDEKLDIIRP